MEKISGIYCWLCEPTEQVYIGQSLNISSRHRQHLNTLRKNEHINQKLQNAFNEHGEDNFKFKILYKCPPDMLNHMEDYFIKKFNSIDDGFNIQNGTIKYRKTECEGNLDTNYYLEELDEIDMFINEKIDSKYNFDKELNVERIEDIINELNFEFNSSISINEFVEIAYRLDLNLYLNFYCHDGNDICHNNKNEYYIKIDKDTMIKLYNKDFNDIEEELCNILKQNNVYSLHSEFPQHYNKKEFISKVEDLKNQINEGLKYLKDTESKLRIEYLNYASTVLENLSLQMSFNDLQNVINKREEIKDKIKETKESIENTRCKFPDVENRYQYCSDGYVISYIKEGKIYDYKYFKEYIYKNILNSIHNQAC